MGTVLLVVSVALGAGLMLWGGILAGVAEPGEKHGPVGLIVVGAALYGVAGAVLWHWAVGLTALMMFTVVAFAVFSRKEWLNG